MSVTNGNKTMKLKLNIFSKNEYKFQLYQAVTRPQPNLKTT